MVIDAKYKPHYHYGELDIEDVRQVSAYARMEGVYKKNKQLDNRIIDCMIVYANQECPPTIPDVLDNLELAKVNI